jgi:hypothetical protein
MLSMVLLVVVGFVLLLALISVPILLDIRNPVVSVLDDLTTTAPYAEVDSELTKLLGNSRGYDIQTLGPGTYTLSYRRSPGWALVLGLLTFPIGILIVLFAREKLTLTLSATATESGTRLLVVGRVHEKLALATGTAVQLRLDGLRAGTGGEQQPHLRS